MQTQKQACKRSYPALQAVKAQESVILLEEEGIFEKNREMWHLSVEFFAALLP